MLYMYAISSLISTRTWVRDKFAPALCGYHGNNKKGSYQGHLFIGEKRRHEVRERKQKHNNNNSNIHAFL